jgi:hypothetical protein
MIGLLKGAWRLTAGRAGNAANFKNFVIGSSSLKGQLPILALTVGLPVLTAPPHEKGKELALSAASWWATSAFLSPGKQMVWGTMLGLSSSFSAISRSVVSGHRTSIEQRTMSAIPFSYTSVNMDQAMITLGSVRERMSMMTYGNKTRAAENLKIGAEAQLYASRYMSK